MPRGRWAQGDGLGGGVYPRRIARFLEPCLLLRSAATHGYNLLEALHQFGFAPGTIDASVVYRILREMEDAGFVSSQWDTAGSGPPRRVYTVTANGETYLWSRGSMTCAAPATKSIASSKPSHGRRKNERLAPRRTHTFQVCARGS